MSEKMKKWKKITVNLPEDEYFALSEISGEQRRPVGDIVREAVSEYLENKRKHVAPVYIVQDNQLVKKMIRFSEYDIIKRMTDSVPESIMRDLGFVDTAVLFDPMSGEEVRFYTKFPLHDLIKELEANPEYQALKNTRKIERKKSLSR